MRSKKILDVRVDLNIDIKYVLKKIEDRFLQDSKFHYICTTNPEFIMEAQKNVDFKNIINKSDLSVPDGAGILMAASYLNRVEGLNKNSFLYPFSCFILGLYTGIEHFLKFDLKDDRITGVQLAEKICEISNTKKYSIFLLGGCPRDKKGNLIRSQKDLAEEAANNLQKKYPKANIIGATSQFGPDEKDDQNTIKYIKRCMQKNKVNKLDFIMVAYGQYKQEKWFIRNQMHIPVKLAIGVGRTFDYFSKYDKQPPVWMRNLRISWLYSLIKQPWRLKRVINAFPIFPFKVFLSTLAKSSIDIK